MRRGEGEGKRRRSGAREERERHSLLFDLFLSSSLAKLPSISNRAACPSFLARSNPRLGCTAATVSDASAPGKGRIRRGERKKKKRKQLAAVSDLRKAAAASGGGGNPPLFLSSFADSYLQGVDVGVHSVQRALRLGRLDERGGVGRADLLHAAGLGGGER